MIKKNHERKLILRSLLGVFMAVSLSPASAWYDPESNSFVTPDSGCTFDKNGNVTGFSARKMKLNGQTYYCRGTLGSQECVSKNEMIAYCKSWWPAERREMIWRAKRDKVYDKGIKHKAFDKKHPLYQSVPPALRGTIKASLAGALDIADPGNYNYPLLDDKKCDFVTQLELKDVQNGKGIFSYKCMNGRKGIFGKTEDQQSRIEGPASTWAHRNGADSGYWVDKFGVSELEKEPKRKEPGLFSRLMGSHKPKIRVGLVMEAMDGPLSFHYDIDYKKGILITEVLKNGPAENAGIKVADIITAINSTKVKNMFEFNKVFNALSVDDKLVFAVHRNGEELEIPVKALPRK